MPAILFLLLGACGGGSKESGSSTVQKIDEETPVTLTLQVRGDVRVDFDGTVPVKLLALRDAAAGVQLLGLRPLEPLRQGPAAYLTGLTVTEYKGNGKYRIAATSADSPAAAQAVSTLGFDWWPTGEIDQEKIVRFGRHLEDCAVEVREDGREGHAVCPKLTTGTGDKTISLDLRWKSPKPTS